MTAVLGTAQAMMFAVAVQTAPQAGPVAAERTPETSVVRPMTRAAEPWTWTLYSGDGPLVLANEIPDTPRLRTTLECMPGSSIARLTFHEAAGADGFATVRSGAVLAEVETRSRHGRLETVLRADHPVFAAFLASGRLMLSIGDQSASIEIDRANLPKLRRFAELCTA